MAKRVFTQTFAVAGALIEKDGKIFLVREAAQAGSPIKNADAGKWNQPAGWIEVGEHPVDAVKKEVKEETGYDFTPTHILGVYSLFRKDVEKQIGTTLHPIKIIFTGIIRGEPETLSDDVTETRWFTKEEIDAMDVSTLRDIDIKQEAADYFAGIRYPLSLVRHAVQLDNTREGV